jgi:hypothetical protein
MNVLGDYLYRRSIRIVTVAALAAVVLAGAGAAPASAQYNNRGWDGHDDHRYDNGRVSRSDIQRIAIVNGYAEGYEHGVSDRRSRRGFNYQHASEYRGARSGYDSRWRMERDYQNWFRQGYSRGYSDGYYGRSRNRDYDRGRLDNGRWNGSYPGSGGYGNGGYYDNREGDKDRDEVARIAAQNGYTAGFQRGQYDAQQRNRSNPQGHGAYQFGFDGFDPNWGSASTYQQTYRSYFVRGYQDGYNRRSYNRSYYRF